jgi:membrane protein DedA with SNARE-associated domain
VTALITHLGPLGVFLLMVPEAACIPVPSEVTLLFSGFAVGQGWMSLPVAILAATLGNLVGSLAAYGLGRAGRGHAAPGPLARCARMLEERGDRAVLTARLLPLARTFVSLPAGRAGVPLPRFVWLTTLGSALWALAFVVAGALAGSAWQAVSGWVGRASLAAGAVALLWVFRPAALRS